jgi:hypothetical protein
MPSAIWTPRDVEFIFSSYENFEKRLLNFLSVVPIDERNYKTWSPDLVSLLLDVCGTIDSISRRIVAGGKKENDKVSVQKVSGQHTQKRVGDLNVEDFEINLWRPINLQKSWAVVYRLYAIFPHCAIDPYDGYRDPGGWWTSYNALKHNRLDTYRSASLLRVLRSLGALFLLLVRYKQDEAFTKALLRRGWVETGVVPEFVHGQRSGGEMWVPIWIDSELFGTHDNFATISSTNITKIQPYLGSSKFQKFLGRCNPEALSS